MLDNCEHLVAGCGSVAQALRRACPDLRILATSRAPLEVSGTGEAARSFRGAYDRDEAEALTTLGEEAFAVAWAAGRAMSLEQAVAFALDESYSSL